MIESVEKQKRLNDIVGRWCKQTQHRNLRGGDIQSLVSQVMSEFYHITLCCGHQVMEMEEAVSIAFNDFITDRGDMEHGGGMGVVSGCYCRDCAEQYKKKLGAWEIK
ncbi:hypothetical protein LCGC14_0964690 [marine sediment metagenome]|uniref:Uncharacterized protein n=1 Tax=marine sediment metagenome TaxID=412755 RepID=A0A0F9NHW5_9ZZZZ